MFGRAIIKSLLLIVNIIVVIALLLSMMGSFVSPDKFLFPAYATLFFPAFVFLNAAFVLIWIFAKKWHFLISLIVLLLAAPKITQAIPLHIGKTNSVVHNKPIHILTYNTHLLAELQKDTQKSPNLVTKYILDSNADIVCLQEFCVSPKNEFITIADVNRIFKKYPYKHIWYYHKDNWLISGIATFSKYKIIHKVNIDTNLDSWASIYSDILINGDTIRVFNNHLESNKLTDKDREMPLLLKDNFDAENLTGTTKHLSQKLGVAYKKRARQADEIGALIKKSPYKVIVCGDFNDVPCSYVYTKMKGDLLDAFAENGFGLGWTLNMPIYKFRIDYILYDKSFKSDNYKVEKVNYSDHYPVRCDLYETTTN